MVLALDDADLVGAALAGDREAFGAIYDRYSSQVFTMCAHMLGNRDDAADVTSDVFLTAAERLDQLRDPSRLRVWLLAIARRNVYRRSSRRSRAVPVAEVEDMTGPLATDHGATESGAESSELSQVLDAAASGLDDGDRAVLELQLLGLEGADLADALGLSPDAAYQASFRMKERLERSIGALLVARQGRGDCTDLDQLLRAWDGTFSVLWRKRVARHVDRCEVCDRRRKALPALLLGGVAGASTLLVVPDRLRDEVLSSIAVGAATGRPWPGDGFPPGPRRAGRRVVAALVVALLVLVALVGTLSADSPGPATTTTSTAVVPPTTTATSTTLPAGVPGAPATPVVPGASPGPSTTVPTTTVPIGRPTSPGAKGSTATSTTSTTSTTTTSTTTTTTVRPPTKPKYPTSPKLPNLPTFPTFTIPTTTPLR